MSIGMFVREFVDPYISLGESRVTKIARKEIASLFRFHLFIGKSSNIGKFELRSTNSLRKFTHCTTLFNSFSWNEGQRVSKFEEAYWMLKLAIKNIDTHIWEMTKYD